MKNFKQFTTIYHFKIGQEPLSMMVQRWRISSNSQLITWPVAPIRRCLWWFKNEEFQAIHNTLFDVTALHVVVYDGSKMKNFKQFTTIVPRRGAQRLLSMMVQKWRISSNSQQVQECLGRSPSCLWWFKDEEFQAIHNKYFDYLDSRKVVYDGSKMKNFMQFTTT